MPRLSANGTVTESLSASQLHSIYSWLKFYHFNPKYHFIGVVEGPYFTSDGELRRASAAVRLLESAVAAHLQSTRAEQPSSIAHVPACMSLYSPTGGGVVWCQQHSTAGLDVRARTATDGSRADEKTGVHGRSSNQ